MATDCIREIHEIISERWEYSRTVIREHLLGIVSAHDGLIAFESGNAILRRDYDNMPGKVKLICGAGVLTAAAYVGFVGPGMLTAVISGNTLNGPPINTIYKVIEEIAFKHSPGILLIVNDCASCCLNFGLAKSRAEKNGYAIKMVTVNDDVASTFPNKSVKEHDFSSILFISKIAGAMAEQGISLNEIYTVCSRLASNREELITLIVCQKAEDSKLTGVTEEKNSKLMKLGQNENEEWILLQKSYTSAKEAALCAKSIFIKRYMKPVLKYEDEQSKFCRDHKVAVFISNLGFNQIETNIFVAEFTKQLKSFNTKLERVYVGSSNTLLTVKGFHVSVLNLSSDSRLIKYLDATTLAPAWPKVLPAEIMGINKGDDIKQSTPGKYSKSIDKLEIVPQGPMMDYQMGQAFLGIISVACEALIACTEQLNIMDQEDGSGNCGTILAVTAIAIKNSIQERKIIGKCPFVALTQINHIVGNVTDDVHGGYYSLFFEAAAKTFLQYRNNKGITAIMWLNALTAANEAVSDFGKVSIGDRTMLDALIPAQLKLQEALRNNSSHIQAFGEAVKAAEDAAMQTAYAKPNNVQKYPRSMYPAPGAHAVGVWMRGAYEATKLKLSSYIVQ